MRPQKTFEISLPKAVYFGTYSFDSNKLVIEEMITHDADGNAVEVDSINDKEAFDRVYSLVEKDKCDELEDEREAVLAERHSRLNNF